jgi:hypothetical protein
MSDPLELESLFGPASNHVDESMYDKISYVEVFDQQNGQYATGQVSFNNDSQMKHHVVYSESYLALPIAATLTTKGRLAVKNSILSFIQGLSVESGSGTVLVSEQMSTPIVANLRLLIDSSLDFIDGNELMYYGADKTVEEDASGALQSVVGGAHGDAPFGQGRVDQALDFRYNPKLCNRITVLANRETVVPSVIPGIDEVRTFVAYIPLKFVHDLFAQMNFPITNLSLRITFNIAGTGSYMGYSPWSTPTFPAHPTMGGIAAPAALKGIAAGADIVDTLAPAVPTAVIGSSSVVSGYADRFGGKHAPRLFLKTVTFRADEAQALKAKIVGGFSKELTYRVSNMYNQAILAGAAAQGINWPFVQGVIRPTRVWVLPLERDAAGRPALASTLNTFPSRIGKLALRDMNIVLNGDNFYNLPFKTQYDYWREFKTQLIGASSSQAAATPISYSDWISGFNPYCFDLSRNASVRSNVLCTMSLVSELIDQTTGAPAAANVDLYVIVERLQVVTFKVSEGGVEVLVKQGADA